MENLKKTLFALLAALASGFGMWVTGGIWHNLILANLYPDQNPVHEGLSILLIAYFILGGFMAYLYPLIYSGEKPLVDGLIFGAIIGLLWTFPHGLAIAGTHGDSIMYEIQNSTYHMLEQGIGGIILAFVFQLSNTLAVRRTQIA